MAIDHLAYIPEVMYIYNDLTSGAEEYRFRNKSRMYLKLIRARKAYERLDCLFRDENLKCMSTKDYVLQKG